MSSIELKRKTYIDIANDLDVRFLRLRHKHLDLHDHDYLRWLACQYDLHYDGFPMFANEYGE